MLGQHSQPHALGRMRMCFGEDQPWRVWVLYMRAHAHSELSGVCATVLFQPDTHSERMAGTFCCIASPVPTRDCAPEQAKVGENLSKQAQLMEVIGKNQAAYKHAFGFEEWRRACDVSALPHSHTLSSFGCSGGTSYSLW